MERVCYLYDEDPLDVHHLALSTAARTTPFAMDCGLSLADATRQFQIAYIEHHLRGGLGRMTETAERLGLHRTNLYRKMKQLGMTPPS
jgi:Nif-specific regulatory protein